MPVRNPYLFALLAVGIAAHAHADSIVTIDVTGVFSGIPGGTTINGQAVSDGAPPGVGTTFDARFYFDSTELTVVENVVSPPETVYQDSSDGDSLVLNGNMSSPAVTDSTGAEIGVDLESEIGPYYDFVFLYNSANSMVAAFGFPNSGPADTSFNSTISALSAAPLALSDFSVFTDQASQVSGTITKITVTPVPLPPAAEVAMVLLGGYGIVAALRNRGRLSRVLRPA
jgi:hypothetical protein